MIDVTRDLYDVVVARHPLGIPHGEDKARISSLLSKRLREELESAQACQADYRRQNPSPATVGKPSWFDAGLFSGDGAMRLPVAGLVDHKERQGDGSFLVFVWLSHENPALHESSPSVPRWRTWQVSALVKSEDGRFVVDDVRLFDDDSIDGPARMISASFAGCDGPHWVGIRSMTK